LLTAIVKKLRVSLKVEVAEKPSSARSRRDV